MPRQEQEPASDAREKESSHRSVERLVRRVAERAAVAARAERRGEMSPTVALALDKALEALRRRIAVADEQD